MISMNTDGLWTGLLDAEGMPICIGDTLRFDEREWGHPCEFVTTFEKGELVHPGAISDLSSFCVVVQRVPA